MQVNENSSDDLSADPGVGVRIALCSLAIVFLLLPILFVCRDLTAWQHSIATLGVVVNTRYEGPFKEGLELEYSVEGESTKHRLTIPSTCTTAQEIGNEVELL